MGQYKVPGVSIAVIDGGGIEWAHGYGVTDVADPRPVTKDTLFQAASISKPLVAMAALSCVQTGLLDLDENVNDKLVSWKVPENEHTQAEKVTLRRLLSHSAGLSGHKFNGYAIGEALPGLRHILDGSPPANSAPIRVILKPGSQWLYSGGGYMLVQQLLEDVTGKAFHELMREIVLQKLEMQNSTYSQPLPEQQARQAASGHSDEGQVIPGRWRIYPEQAAAGLWTTPSDLAGFIIEIQRAACGFLGSILSPGLTRQMLAPQIQDWGLGLQVGGSAADTWFAQGGMRDGYRCYLFGFVKSGQGAVVMTNGDNGYKLAMEIIRTIAGVYGWMFTPFE
jgi:CubicO group peptidase (beta-lactamase class C family)